MSSGRYHVIAAPRSLGPPIPRPPARFTGVLGPRASRTSSRGGSTSLHASPFDPIGFFVDMMFGAGALAMSRKKGISTPRGPMAVQIPSQSLSSPAEIAEAKAESDRILRALPRDESDPAIIPHLIAAASPDTPVLFDGGGAEGGTEASQKYPFMLPCPDEPWQLTLSGVPSACKGDSIPAVLNDEAARAKFESDVRKRIAASLGVDESKVRITGLREGSVVVEYTVADLTPEQKDMIMLLMDNLDEKFAAEFDTYVSSKIPVAALALKLPLAYFDSAGTRNSWEGSAFDVGPDGNTRVYTQPVGWARYGLRVLGAFDCDRWLRPFGNDGNWYRAFHGMSDPQRSARAILDDGWIPSGDPRHARTAASHGPGVYVSPYADYAEKYCGSLAVPTIQGKKNFKIAFHLAVRPGAQKEATDNEWVVEDPTAVRPYGLLVKPEQPEEV